MNFLWRRRLLLALRAGAFGIVALLTLLGLVLAWIGYSGRNDWDKIKRDLLAKGEKLSYSEIVVPSLPEEQNFYAHPIWRELFDHVERQGENGRSVLTIRTPRGERQIDRLTTIKMIDGQKQIPLTAAGDSKNPDIFLHNVAKKMREANLPGSDDPSVSSSQTILNVLNQVAPEWGILETLAERPAAVPLNRRLGFSNPVEHLPELLRLGQFLSLRARASLAVGDSETAFRDARLLFRLADLMQGERLMIAELVRISMLGMATGTIKRGIELHTWNDEQLSAFEHLISRENILLSAAMALRGERGLFNQMMETVAASGYLSSVLDLEGAANLSDEEKGTLLILPALLDGVYVKFFLSGDQASHNSYIQGLIERLSGPKNPILLDDEEVSSFDLWPRQRYPLFMLAKPAIDSFFIRAYYGQVQIDQTALAILLERYRLRHGRYPDHLQSLVPEFMQTIPKDLLDGKPMRYRLDKDGHFKLWSIGWNRVDDGGTKRSHDPKKGDWVWGGVPQ